MHRIQQPDSPADILAGTFSRMVQLGVIDIPTLPLACLHHRTGS